MSKQKHTPGPWSILDGAILSDKINAYGNFHIARFDRGDDPNTAEDYANARLIAAAPDLLEACKKYVGELEIDDIGQRDMEGAEKAIRAAIAAAESEVRNEIFTDTILFVANGGRG